MNAANQAADGMMTESELRTQLASHHAVSFGWALSCCAHHQAEAEDVLQTVYLKILQGRARFHGRSSFKTWLFAVIRNTAADERRRQWLRALGLALFVRRRAQEPTGAEPAGRWAAAEVQRDLQAALARLPRRQREILHLVFYQDLSVQAASEVMGVSVGSARTHYERGKKRLRQWLQPAERGYAS